MTDGQGAMGQQHYVGGSEAVIIYVYVRGRG